MSSHLPDGTRLAYGTATAAYQVEGVHHRRRPRPVDLGHVHRAAGHHQGRQRRLGGLRVLPAAGRRPRAAGRPRRRLLPLLGGLAAGAARPGRERSSRAGSPTTTGWSTACWRAACSRWRRSTTGTCRSRSRTPAAGRSATTAERFADYAAIVHDHLGDRVRIWATHNEPWCAAYLGYAAGVHAPGKREPDAAHRAAHHLLLGHGLAAARLHEAGADTVGIVLNLTPVWPERPEAADAADGVDAIHNRVWLGPLVDGAYDERLRAARADRSTTPTVVRDGDLDPRAGLGRLARRQLLHAGPRRRRRRRRRSAGPSARTPRRTRASPTCGSPRASPGPPWAGRSSRAGWRSCSSTPTGAPASPSSSRRTARRTTTARAPTDGSVDDPDRIAYLRDHLAAVERARSAGADVRAYVAWTLLDNFEWAEGYTKKFGLVEVDSVDQHPDSEGLLSLVCRAAARRHRPHVLALDAARQQPADEVALQAEEHDQRHDQRRRRHRRTAAASRCPRVPDSSASRTVSGERSGCRRRRPAPPAGRSRPRGTGRCRTPRWPASAAAA